MEELSIPVQSTEEPEELEGAVGGASVPVEQDTSSTDWLLSSDLGDPDLLGKIRCNSLRNVLVLNGNCSKHFKSGNRKLKKLRDDKAIVWTTVDEMDELFNPFPLKRREKCKGKKRGNRPQDLDSDSS